MTKPKQKSTSSWTDIKTRLASFDRSGLLDLVHDLYTLSKDNQVFLHTRFGDSDDVLRPYKNTLQRWISPDVLRNQDVSVSKAKRAISAYRKAIGDSAGLAELMVFYCERATHFSLDFGMDEEGYLDALIRMFAQALRVLQHLPAADRESLMVRLNWVRASCQDFGYGVGDTMDDLYCEHTESDSDVP